jgi:hypothetical protein
MSRFDPIAIGCMRAGTWYERGRIGEPDRLSIAHFGNRWECIIGEGARRLTLIYDVDHDEAVRQLRANGADIDDYGGSSLNNGGSSPHYGGSPTDIEGGGGDE